MVIVRASMSDTPQLSNLRNAIADVDRALIDLLRRRMDLAGEIGRLKAEEGAPVVVRDVEQSVLTRARAHADACGVSESVMETIFAAIIQGSVERQHRVGVELRSRAGGRVLIAGGAGAMGRWFRGFLELAGQHIDSLDPSLARLPRERGTFARLADVRDLDLYDAILVAVPLASTPEVVRAIVERSPRGLVVEIASIKDPLRPALEIARARGVRVACLHPMFGPGKSVYAPLTFALACHEEEDIEKARVAALLTHPYTQLVAMPFDHHDRMMGWLLGLAHLIGMAFASALARSGLDPEELARCASTTFARQTSTALSILSEDSGLYFDIQRLNPHRDAVYSAARAALEELVERVRDDDREAFRATLAKARAALAPLVGSE